MAPEEASNATLAITCSFGTRKNLLQAAGWPLLNIPDACWVPGGVSGLIKQTAMGSELNAEVIKSMQAEVDKAAVAVHGLEVPMEGEYYVSCLVHIDAADGSVARKDPGTQACMHVWIHMRCA
jgi:hypothetical protein